MDYSYQFQPSQSAIFQITGILVILFLIFFIQRDRRLRAHLHRAFFHPHGLYIDIYENRKIAPFLTMFIGFTECLITALLIVQLCYTFRSHIIFDQTLNIFLYSPVSKAAALWLIWNPGLFIAIVTGTLLNFAMMAAIFMRIIGFFRKNSLPLGQYISLIFWVPANLLLLGVIAPIFHQSLLIPSLVKPTLLSILAIIIWLLGRSFRAFRVFYMLSFFKALSILLIFITILLIGIIFNIEDVQSIFDYLS